MAADKLVTRVRRQVAASLTSCGLSGGKSLVVAVSGGPDSLALLHCLHDLRCELGLKLYGAHLDHGLRDGASARDAEFVEEVFRRWGIPFSVEHADVCTLRRRRRLSLEEAARIVRYEFLCRAALERGADGIAVGHTSDDQAETVLMHIIRGTGTAGLRGMKLLSQRRFRSTSVAIVRPLLRVPRRDTVAYCRALNLEPRQDESNLSAELTRNRVRIELIPLLERYNPAIRSALLRLSGGASRDLAHLESEVRRAWDPAVRRRGRDVVLDRAEFAKLSPAVQGHLLRRAVRQIDGDLSDLESYHVDEMIRLMAGSAGRSLDLPRGVRFSVSYAEATLGPDDNSESWPPGIADEYLLSVPGETQVPGWRISAKIVDPGEGPGCQVAAVSEGSRSIAGPEPTSDLSRVANFGPDGLCARLSGGAAGIKLWVRSRRPGDRFHPLGMSQAKKLQDFMVDARIPRPLRDRVPLVVSPKGIVWVAGWRIAEWAKVVETSGPELRLRLIPR